MFKDKICIEELHITRNNLSRCMVPRYMISIFVKKLLYQSNSYEHCHDTYSVVVFDKQENLKHSESVEDYRKINIRVG